MDKSSFGYFIVKPDGAKDINGILDDIEDKFDEDMIRYYKIDNFDEVVNELYYKHFEEKGDKFKNSFSDYLKALNEIYGNKALLIFIESKTKNYDTLGKQILTDLNFRSVKQRLFTAPGNYRMSDFNVIHSPDSDEKTIKNELRILHKIGVLKSENQLDKIIIDKLKKYKTFEVLGVDKRNIGIEYPSVGEYITDSIRRGN